tara:strand:- start:1048 stop:1374 length:327 start_codon:yes stop_codon:yes gene_type:complete
MKYLDPNANAKLSNGEVIQKYDRNGEPVLNAKELDVAKIVKTKNNETTYLKIHNNVPYDPKGMYSHREQAIDLKYKKVSRETFDYYMLYLKTKNSLYMTRTQRSFIND